MAMDFCFDLGVLLLGIAAVTDLAARIVPNWLPVVLGADGLVIQIQSRTVMLSALAAFVVFVIAVACWRRDLMGGGDVKLLAAASLLVQPVVVPRLIIAIALAGGVLGVLYWVMGHAMRRPPVGRPRRIVRRILRIERYRISRGSSLPYAVAIAAGTVYAMARGVTT